MQPTQSKAVPQGKSQDSKSQVPVKAPLPIDPEQLRQVGGGLGSPNKGW